jgi:hypothetical protein
VANPYAKNITDGHVAPLAEEQEQEGTRDSTTAPKNAELGQARSTTNVDNSAEGIAAIFCNLHSARAGHHDCCQEELVSLDLGAI